jgi:hypothetical protein
MRNPDTRRLMIRLREACEICCTPQGDRGPRAERSAVNTEQGTNGHHNLRRGRVRASEMPSLVVSWNRPALRQRVQDGRLQFAVAAAAICSNPLAIAAIIFSPSSIEEQGSARTLSSRQNSTANLAIQTPVGEQARRRVRHALPPGRLHRASCVHDVAVARDLTTAEATLGSDVSSKMAARS